MAFAHAIKLDELTIGVGRQHIINGKTLALFLTESGCYAIDDACPHRGAPLHEGACIGTEVVCPWHSARFDLTNGTHQNPPAKSGVRSYPIRVQDGMIEIDVD